jgi:hypothetical protein
MQSSAIDTKVFCYLISSTPAAWQHCDYDLPNGMRRTFVGSRECLVEKSPGIGCHAAVSRR